jgi:hypothetical protein
VLPATLLTKPVGHGLHASAPLLGMNEPGAQFMHVDAPTAVLLARLY